MRHHHLRPAQSWRYAGRCRPCPSPSRNGWATCFSRIGKLTEITHFWSASKSRRRGSDMKGRHSHILELQSLRGIAAGMVLLHHTSFLFDTTPAFHYWAEVLINAHAAVMLFFVLSGYVLSRSLSGVAIDCESLFSFYAARLFRIYPMAWVACLAASLYVIFLHNRVPTIGASQWYTHFWQPSFDLKTGAMSFLTFKAQLLPPIW